MWEFLLRAIFVETFLRTRSATLMLRTGFAEFFG